MSSGSAHEDSGHMPARLVQKQKELDALPEYEDLDQPIPKISLGFDSLSLSPSWLGFVPDEAPCTCICIVTSWLNG